MGSYRHELFLSKPFENKSDKACPFKPKYIGLNTFPTTLTFSYTGTIRAS